MRYQRVVWRHQDASEPVVLFAEIDDDGWECRKVDEYPDGKLNWADRRAGTGSSEISDQQIPALESINSQGPFDAAAITAQEFEEVWVHAITGLPQPEAAQRGRRGEAALIPFYEAGIIQANPEDLEEMAFAVLQHANSQRAVDEVYEASKRQVAVYLFERRQFQLEAYGRYDPIEAAVRSVLEFIASGDFDLIRHACSTRHRAAVDLRSTIERCAPKLSKPNNDWWSTVTVTSMAPGGPGYRVTAPLWTTSGRSDLSLELWLFPGRRGSLQVEVLDLRPA